MSLYGTDARYTWGVIRNAQLVPVYLPDWSLRVYVTADQEHSKLAVPLRILKKLRLLGAEIAKVSTKSAIEPRNWRLLAAVDQHLDYFLVRDADSRLSKREAAAVRDWLSAVERNIVHCIRDHPKHSEQAIVDGLWGGRPRKLSQQLNIQLTDMLELVSRHETSNKKTNVLSDVLWPAVADNAYCHDSVSPCNRWTPAASRHPFPISRHGKGYLGQKYNQHQVLISNDGYLLKDDVMCH